MLCSTASDMGMSPEVAYRGLQENPPTGVRWLGPDHLNDGFAEDLRHDIESIEGMLNRFGQWNPDTDGKIAALADLAINRHGKEKVLVFTEYTDTADYVAESLKQMGVQDLDVLPMDVVDRLFGMSEGLLV